MLSQLTPRHLLWILPVALVALVIACSGSTVKSPAAPTDPSAGNGSTPGPGPSGTGILSIMIKDSPFSEATALLVTFSEVSVHASGGDWVTLPFAGDATTRTCDLKRLVDSQDVLGVGQLTAGHYTQLRVTVTSAKIYFTAKTSTAGPVCAPALTLSPTTDPGVTVDLPSGTLKLNHPFDLVASTTTPTTILLDFDGDKSIHQTGNDKYKMMPVISVVSVQ